MLFDDTALKNLDLNGAQMLNILDLTIALSVNFEYCTLTSMIVPVPQEMIVTFYEGDMLTAIVKVRHLLRMSWQYQWRIQDFP